MPGSGPKNGFDWIHYGGELPSSVPLPIPFRTLGLVERTPVGVVMGGDHDGYKSLISGIFRDFLNIDDSHLRWSCSSLGGHSFLT